MDNYRFVIKSVNPDAIIVCWSSYGMSSGMQMIPVTKECL